MQKRSKTQKWNDTHNCTTKIVKINNTDAQMTHGLKHVLNHYLKRISKILCKYIDSNTIVFDKIYFIVSGLPINCRLIKFGSIKKGCLIKRWMLCGRH